MGVLTPEEIKKLLEKATAFPPAVFHCTEMHMVLLTLQNAEKTSQLAAKASRIMQKAFHMAISERDRARSQRDDVLKALSLMSKGEPIPIQLDQKVTKMLKQWEESAS